MSGKVTKPKQIRRSVSLAEKLEIIRLIETEKRKQTAVAKEKNLPRSTVQQIYSDRIKITQSISNFSLASKKSRPSTFPEIDEELCKWFDSARAQNLPINGSYLLEKAQIIAKEKGIAEFKGSPGWIDSWKRRHGISFYKSCGEAGSVSEEVVKTWLESVWPGLKAGYADEDIYNADETGLFFKLLPDRTLNRKGRRCTNGKLSKERVTLLLCSNSTGTHKLKPVVIGKSAKPRCFKKVKPDSLPVTYYSNGRAWMTRELFTTWLKQVNLEMSQRKKKILLVLDNCSAHTDIKAKLSNIKIVYLPKNCTSRLQPLDCGIINETKKLYRKSLLRKILGEWERNGLRPTGIPDLLEAIFLVASAWNELRSAVVANCFRKSDLVSGQPEVEFIEDAPNDSVDEARFGINAEEMEEFYVLDNDLATSELPKATSAQPDEDEVTISESEHEDVEVEEEEEGTLSPEVTPANVLDSLHVIKRWLVTQDGGGELFRAVYDIESFATKTIVNNLRQAKITEYLSS